MMNLLVKILVEVFQSKNLTLREISQEIFILNIQIKSKEKQMTNFIKKTKSYLENI